MPERELTVAGLPATLSLPAGTVRGGVVPLHPASDGSRRQLLFDDLAETLAPRGLAVLRFDRRTSPTDEDVPFEAQAEDALAALGMLRDEVCDVPLGLWAWSQGAWAAALAAARSSEIVFLVLLAACGVSPAVQMRYGTAEQLRRSGYDDQDALRELAELRAALEESLRDRSRLEAAQAVVDRYAGRPWFPLAHVPRTLDPTTDWPDMDFDPAPSLGSVRCPVLLFYGEEDEWTPIEPSIAAWERSGNEEVTVVRLPGTDHAPTIGGAISPAYTQTLTEWLDDVLAAR
ncbi:MAG TPA: alpha/beta hydrolase [Gaiellaceae bacterium]|nr:alpha/beta hydrolase [Gaiellaceae bacterium]